MAKQLPLTIDGWLQWLDAVNMQAEAFLEDNNAIHARSILRDGLGQFGNSAGSAFTSDNIMYKPGRSFGWIGNWRPA